MQYELLIGETEQTVAASPVAPDGRVSLTFDDTLWEGRIATVDGHRVLLEGDGAPREAWAARAPDGIWVWCDGRARLVQDASARRARRRGGGAGVGRDVTPPMPAVVTNLLCAEGDVVTKGQSLVVVAAMKMEMTLVAPFAGTVAAVRTAVGAKVNPGEILVEIAPEAAPETPATEERHG